MPHGPWNLASLRRHLNFMSPAAHDANLGDVIVGLLAAHNDLVAKHNAFLAHVDAGAVAGIGTTNAATYGASADTLLQLDQR